MDKKVAKFKKLFPQESLIQLFNSRSEIGLLYKLITEEDIWTLVNRRA